MPLNYLYISVHTIFIQARFQTNFVSATYSRCMMHCLFVTPSHIRLQLPTRVPRTNQTWRCRTQGICHKSAPPALVLFIISICLLGLLYSMPHIIKVQLLMVEGFTIRFSEGVKFACFNVCLPKADLKTACFSLSSHTNRYLTFASSKSF